MLWGIITAPTTPTIWTTAYEATEGRNPETTSDQVEEENPPSTACKRIQILTNSVNVDEPNQEVLPSATLIGSGLTMSRLAKKQAHIIIITDTTNPSNTRVPCRYLGKAVAANKATSWELTGLPRM